MMVIKMINDKEEVYWTLFEDEEWKLYLAATSKGLCYVGSPNAPFDELVKWVNKKIKNNQLIENKMMLRPYEQELKEYLHGSLKEFKMALDLRGTAFQHLVWDELLKVPYHQKATYTEIANRISRPDAIRAVGTAIGANPILIVIPCHRMFGKHGECRGYRGGLEMKGKLLKIENDH